MELLSSLILFLSALLAGGVVLFLNRNLEKQIKLLLTFSGAYLLAICLLELLPGIYQTGNEWIGLYVFAGFLIQLLLEFFSGGLEHGHIHEKENRFPWGIFISLSVHAFVEGLPLGNSGEAHHHSLLTGIALHKIPVAIALTSLFVKSFPQHHRIIWISLIFFSLMAPLGNLTGSFLHNLDIQDLESLFTKIIAIVSGVFLHVSTTILFESTEGHRFNTMKLLCLLAGAALAFGTT